MESNEKTNLEKKIRKEAILCKTCERPYFEREYKFWPVFDNHLFYDYLLAICPLGHENRIYD